MYTDIYYLLLGGALGLTLAGAPGPINAVVASESTKSRLHGFAVVLGATSADFTYFLIMFFFSSIIPQELVNYFYVIGSLLLLYMAYSIIRAKTSNRKPKGNFFVGYMMAITSPFNLSWWLTAGLFLLKSLTIYSLIGLFLGIFLFAIPFVAIIFRLRRNIDSRIIRYISSAILVLFSLFMLFKVFFP